MILKLLKVFILCISITDIYSASDGNEGVNDMYDCLSRSKRNNETVQYNISEPKLLSRILKSIKSNGVIVEKDRVFPLFLGSPMHFDTVSSKIIHKPAGKFLQSNINYSSNDSADNSTFRTIELQNRGDFQFEKPPSIEIHMKVRSSLRNASRYNETGISIRNKAGLMDSSVIKIGRDLQYKNNYVEQSNGTIKGVRADGIIVSGEKIFPIIMGTPFHLHDVESKPVNSQIFPPQETTAGNLHTLIAPLDDSSGKLSTVAIMEGDATQRKQASFNLWTTESYGGSEAPAMKEFRQFVQMVQMSNTTKVQATSNHPAKGNSSNFYGFFFTSVVPTTVNNAPKSKTKNYYRFFFRKKNNKTL